VLREVTGNLFLDALPPAAAEALSRTLSRVRLTTGEVLVQADQSADEVYFPVDSLISTITRMADGTAIEVGATGREGISPLSQALGRSVSPHTTVVQVGGNAYRGSAIRFTSRMERDVALRTRLLACAQYALVAATQLAACNKVHSIEERYARWLLMADDRVGNELTLTHETSAQILGVRRAGVTVVAGMMASAGIIRYRRGHVTVLDRKRLLGASCECYNVVNDEMARLMGYDVRESFCRVPA
jgi:CRP-like cAMP-binding protein